MHEVLLVCKDEDWGDSEFLLLEKFVEFFSGFLDALGVGGVDNVDEGIGVGEVVAPVLTEGLLTSDIPDVEFELVVGQVFDVESLGGGDGVDGLTAGMSTSLDSDLRMVVLPALSRPSTRIRSYSFLFLRKLRRMPISPPA